MPEGHTLHRLARLHERRLAGARVRVSSPQGRFAEGADLVDGRTLLNAQAWGKHLLHRYAGNVFVHIHLGLYGAFTESPLPMPEPVGQVRMRLFGPGRDGTGFGTDLRGPTACEILRPPEVEALFDRLGPDPLRTDADPDRAWARIRRSRRSIGSLLMDQRVVAGIGNVYRAEVLFRQGIPPDRAGSDIGAQQWDALWVDLAALMQVGVRRGKMHVVRSEHDHGAPAYAADRPRTYVYRRAGEICRCCSETVRHRVLEGRNLFWCPGCQSG